MPLKGSAARSDWRTVHAPRHLGPQPPAPFAFDPDIDAILPVDECWLVDPRLLAHRADPTGSKSYAAAYSIAVAELAALGLRSVPDPSVGDACPEDVVAICIVYRAATDEHEHRTSEHRELHLQLVCAMARTDGAFVGSELTVALEIADRIADGDEPLRRRFRALVHELFISPTAMPDPIARLSQMPREQALEIVEHLKAMAWADGRLRAAEHRMLCRVHELLGLPVHLVGALSTSSRYVDPLAA